MEPLQNSYADVCTGASAWAGDSKGPAPWPLSSFSVMNVTGSSKPGNSTI